MNYYTNDLRYLKELRKRIKRRSKRLDSYYKHAEKYENRIGVHKPKLQEIFSILTSLVKE